MKLHDLRPAKGSVHNNTRLGRGEGSRKGGQSTRGHKGAKSRSGYSKKIGFEGGQMPLQRRVPKFGFTNLNRKEYEVVNLSRLQEWADANKIDSEVDLKSFRELGIAGKNDLVKILADGKLEAKLKVSAHKFSASAKEAIEKAGGEVVTL